MKRIVVLLAAVLGFLPQVHAQGAGVTADLSVVEDQLLPDEAMQLKVRIRNLSGQDIHLGKDSSWISFTMFGEKDAPVDSLAEVPATGEFTLQSAEEGARKFDLTPYFNCRAPGHYTIKATIRLAQWDQTVTCTPVHFNIVKGVPVLNLPGVGVPPPPGVTNAAPEIRMYSLEKASFPAGLRLYFRLRDGASGATLKVFSIGTYLSFGDPEARIDRLSNLHVLHQNGARTFSYSVINPRGQILDRRTYEQVGTRPVLTADNSGSISVMGGQRLVSPTDIPPQEIGLGAKP